jgi:hypothetical protein
VALAIAGSASIIVDAAVQAFREGAGPVAVQLQAASIAAARVAHWPSRGNGPVRTESAGQQDARVDRLRRGAQHRGAHHPGGDVDHPGHLDPARDAVVQQHQDVQRGGVDLDTSPGAATASDPNVPCGRPASDRRVDADPVTWRPRASVPNSR